MSENVHAFVEKQINNWSNYLYITIYHDYFAGCPIPCTQNNKLKFNGKAIMEYFMLNKYKLRK